MGPGSWAPPTGLPMTGEPEIFAGRCSDEAKISIDRSISGIGVAPGVSRAWHRRALLR